MENNYAFIDSQNLNLGVSNDIINHHGKKVYTGWKLDFHKFRIFLEDKYRVTKAFLFIGYVPGNEGLYKDLQKAGYIVVFKPTLQIKNGSTKKPTTKGNVDAELVLHSSAIEIENYDTAVIVSGDGDFHCLYEYLASRNKLKAILVPNKVRYSSLLNKFIKYLHFVGDNRVKLEA